MYTLSVATQPAARRTRLDVFSYLSASPSHGRAPLRSTMPELRECNKGLSLRRNRAALVPSATQPDRDAQRSSDRSNTPDSDEDSRKVESSWEQIQQLLSSAGFAGVEGSLDAEAEGELGEEPLGMSMGTWRLRSLVCPQIEMLVAQIEDCWREVLSDLALYSLPKEYRYMDSLDPEGKVPFSYQVLKDPKKGEPGWPRLQVENRCYQSRAFRKLHLEVAVRQDGLQVLHCVMYPRLQFELPILSMDLVANDGRVSLAIIDPCPVSHNLTLPPHYLQSVRELQEAYSLQNNRTVPDWGKAIFSSECIILRPTEGREIAEFLKYAIALSEVHVQFGRLINPTNQPKKLEELQAAHTRYCSKQLENDKTRQVLAKSFGVDKAEGYMQTVMFDSEFVSLS